MNESLRNLCEKIEFSGTIKLIEGKNDLHQAYGYANRSNQISNDLDTRFGIASGCKLYTAIAVCQLVEAGKLSFQTSMRDCLDDDFPHVSKEVTVHHLLTHSSGVADYFDEEVMVNFEELWIEFPMYTLRNLKDFLPLFQQGKVAFQPGERFHYNNAGYILLGLIVEKISGMPFSEYVERNIFAKAEMTKSGYFMLDRLPENTAYGYIDNDNDGNWRTNIYSIPIKGGADGGAFTTASDMSKCWRALLNNELLSQEYTQKLFTPYMSEVDDADECYGYGIWISKRNGEIFKYHIMGYDPGVSFHSAVYPKEDVTLTVLSNKESGPFDVMSLVENKLIE